MTELEALEGLIKYATEAGKAPAVWQDNTWKAKYYTYYNIVFDALQNKQDGKIELFKELLDKGQYVESAHDSIRSNSEIYWGLLKDDFIKLIAKFGLKIR